MKRRALLRLIPTAVTTGTLADMLGVKPTPPSSSFTAIRGIPGINAETGNHDEIMAELHTRYPDYNFIANKGYPTAEHRRVVKEIGPCPVHRRSFTGVREHVKKADNAR